VKGDGRAPLSFTGFTTGLRDLAERDGIESPVCGARSEALTSCEVMTVRLFPAPVSTKCDSRELLQSSLTCSTR
jgi:hypothetical protein